MEAILSAVTGPIKGAIFRIGEEEVAIGRHASNQLCISDPSVSRAHCVIKPLPGGYGVQDLGSQNGTYVNGEAVGERTLANGDRLGVGETIFEFAISSGSPEGPQILIPAEQDEGLTRSTIHLTASAMSMPAAVSLHALLTGLGRLLSEDLTVESLCAQIFGTLSLMAPVDSGAILLVGYGPHDPPSTIGWDKRLGVSSTARASRALVNEAIKSGEGLLSTEAAGEPGNDPATVLVAPMRVRGKIRSVISLEARGSDSLREEHLHALTTLSGYLGLALESAREAERSEEAAEPQAAELKLQHAIVGDSPRIRAVYQRIARIARSEATVLVRGETGTGKELAARAIHENSSRANRPFESLNCALLKDNLLESELFGHERGAFTGAVVQKKGKFEAADGGTVFLDEVAEMPEPTQSMLLRVLQERTFQRLGGNRTIQVDIRVIAATNKDLEAAVRSGTFRADLYYRLNVVSIMLPALRERREDIAALAHHFVRRYSEKNKRAVTGLSPEAVAYFEDYDWPGNVRELENAVEYAVVFGSTDIILPEDLPEHILHTGSPAGAAPIRYADAVKEAKKQIVLNALHQANNNYGAAARLLNIHVNNLHRLIRELNLKSRLKAGQSGTSAPTA